MQVPVEVTVVSFKLDTGPLVNIFPEHEYRKLKMEPKASSRNIKITGYKGTNVPVKTRCIPSTQYENRVCTLPFLVVSKEVTILLDLEACGKLNLVKRELASYLLMILLASMAQIQTVYLGRSQLFQNTRSNHVLIGRNASMHTCKCYHAGRGLSLSGP